MENHSSILIIQMHFAANQFNCLVSNNYLYLCFGATRFLFFIPQEQIDKFFSDNNFTLPPQESNFETSYKGWFAG